MQAIGGAPVTINVPVAVKLMTAALAASGEPQCQPQECRNAMDQAVQAGLCLDVVDKFGTGQAAWLQYWVANCKVRGPSPLKVNSRNGSASARCSARRWMALHSLWMANWT